MSQRPFVTANFAITADGRISTRSRTPSDFSSAMDKRRLLEIRAGCDAVMAGARTVSADTMSMGLPPGLLRERRASKGLSPCPLRVIVSNQGNLSSRWKVFTAEVPNVPIVFSTRRMATRKVSEIAGVSDLYLHLGDEVDLTLMLATLRADYGVRRVVCEGGGTLLRALLAKSLLDELHLTLCPRIFGGAAAATLTGIHTAWLPHSTELRLIDWQSVEGELFTRWRVAGRGGRCD